jgi:hypothetical protein
MSQFDVNGQSGAALMRVPGTLRCVYVEVSSARRVVSFLIAMFMTFIMSKERQQSLASNQEWRRERSYITQS